MKGYDSHFISIGNGKGIATYYKSDMVQHQQDVKETNMQVTKFTSPDLDIINVYRSRNGHSVELLNHILRMLTVGKPSLITGDFNICYYINRNNRMSQGLQINGFKQLVTDATHIRGGYIDHAYWRDPQDVWADPVIDRYSPYYSDHDGICTTLTKKVRVAYYKLVFLIVLNFRNCKMIMADTLNTEQPSSAGRVTENEVTP